MSPRNRLIPKGRLMMRHKLTPSIQTAFLCLIAFLTLSSSQAQESRSGGSVQAASPSSGRLNPRPEDGWEVHLDWAFDRAQQAGQPLLVYFMSANSPPCRAMDREVLSNERVLRELRQVEQVRINVDEQPAMAGYYKIDQLPTFVILDNQGEEFDRFSGFLPPGAFIETMRLAINPKLAINRLIQHTARNKKDMQARWILAQKYARDRNRGGLDSVLDEMRQLDPENKEQYLDNVAYLEIMTSLNPRQPGDGVRACERFLKEFKNSELADQIALTLAHLHYQMGERKKAIRLLEKFPRNYPRSALAEQVKADLRNIRKGR